MRRANLVALLTSACFLGLSSGANATSVNLRWVGGTASAGSVTGIGTNSVTIAPSAVATLTLDIRIAVDSAGLCCAFLSLEFDRDLGNELNILSFQELSWTGAKMTKVVPNLTQLTPNLVSTQESTGSQMGQLYTFEAETLGDGPVSTTIAFGRVVFTTNHGIVPSDRADVFSGPFNVGADGLFSNFVDNNDITNSVVYGKAWVNIPEPSALGMLGVGLGALAAAGRRRRVS